MTQTNVSRVGRSGDTTPTTSAGTRTYDPQHLLNEVTVRLELQGVLPHRSTPADPWAAYMACRDLLAALGVQSSTPALAVAA
jgi:hypothetical protein